MDYLEFDNIPIVIEFSEFTDLHIIFYSMYIGVKKSMDLWVEEEKLKDFIYFCNKYKIYLKYDIKFINNNDYGAYKDVIGKENLTTTKSIGGSINSINTGKVHCFISMDKKKLNNLYKYGWYPVVIGNRVIYKNYHDLSEFGQHLGYPKCCVKNFFLKNDWRFYNFPYEIYKASIKYDYRCNSFWKDYFGISYIYHMPCNFGCNRTIKYVQKIIDELNKNNKDITKKIEYYLLLPILSIREQKIYAFDGVVSNDNLSIKYNKYYNLGKSYELDLSMYLSNGNTIRLEKNLINIYFDSKLIYSYDTLKSEQIEVPFIVKFKKY